MTTVTKLLLLSSSLSELIDLFRLLEPVFQAARQEFRVLENTLQLIVLGKVAEALDEDGEEEHSQVCYYILSGNKDDAFSLDKMTRELRAQINLDRESTAVYSNVT